MKNLLKITKLLSEMVEENDEVFHVLVANGTAEVFVRSKCGLEDWRVSENNGGVKMYEVEALPNVIVKRLEVSNEG